MKLQAIVLLCGIGTGLVSGQTPSLSLRVETESGRAQFQIGEAIGLKLTFDNAGSAAADKWLVTLTGRNRSVLGMGRDRFIVSPEAGTSDPWQYRFSGGIAYSGPPGMYLREKPTVAHADLNQWVRFEKPGHYEIRAAFHATGPGREDLPLESNAIGIDIVAADPQWQAKELADAVAILTATNGKPDSHSYEQRTQAAGRLAYLDTPGSLREIARLLGSPDAQLAQFLQGWLRSTRHPDEAVAAMKELFRDPSQPVTPLFIDAMAAFKVGTAEELRSELAAQIDKKQGAAKAISIKTVIDDLPAAKLRTEIAAVFLTLPVSQQAELLGARWDKITGPEMIAPLRQIYADAPQTRYPENPLLATAVERLYELDPNQTRRLLLDEIARPEPRLPLSDTLAMLPDATLPEVELTLMDHLEHNGGRTAEELISRYATAAILDRVKAFYAKHDAEMRARTSSNVPDIASPACEPPLVAYFLRVDAATGERLALRQSLGERGYPMGRCWMSIIGQTAQYNAGAVWEKMAIESLNDGTVIVKADAVKALGEYGSRASSTAVLESFRAWHDWWKDKPSELNEENRRFEQVYAQAIGRAKNWKSTGDELMKTADYCITDYCRGQFQEYSNEAKRP